MSILGEAFVDLFVHFVFLELFFPLYFMLYCIRLLSFFLRQAWNGKLIGKHTLHSLNR